MNYSEKTNDHTTENENLKLELVGILAEMDEIEIDAFISCVRHGLRAQFQDTCQSASRPFH